MWFVRKGPCPGRTEDEAQKRRIMLQKLIGIVVLLAVMAGCTSNSALPQAGSQGAGQPPEQVGAVSADQSFAAPVSQEANSLTNGSTASNSGASTSGAAASMPGAASDVADTAPAAQNEAAAVPAATASAADTASLNPLTGLPVEDPAALALAPALVSITNFPVSARPQAGLSFSPFVFEMYVGEGMTRFLALFYGDYPVKGDDTALALSDDRIGPVRSGRLPYESLRTLYNGFLIMASASPNVKASLGSYTNVFGTDDSDINSALIPATRLKEIATNNPKRLDQAALDVLNFDAAAPQGGKPAQSLWIPYSYLNQIFWHYDAASGAYLRYQDHADGQTFIQATDRLNGEPLSYENVVVLFADHTAHKETLIDIDFMYIKRMPALLFRDGQVYPIYWTTANGDYEKQTGQVRPIRFIDANGNPFALKPGQTWVEIVPSFTAYNETVASENYAALKTGRTPGSGNWAVQFYPPVSE
jgi:hypothetical protein